MKRLLLFLVALLSLWGQAIKRGRQNAVMSLLVLLTVFVAGGVLGVYGQTVQSGEEVKNGPSYPVREPAVPPKGINGKAPEILRLFWNPSCRSYEVYPDKFIAWTTDTSAVISAIGDRDLIKKISYDPFSKWAVTVMAPDEESGVTLMDKVKNTKGVYRVENYVYNPTPGSKRELYPTDRVKIRLKEASDTLRLKEIAKKLNMRIYNLTLFWPGRYWKLELGPDTPLSRIEVIERLLEAELKYDNISLEWDYDRSYVFEFTYDPGVKNQWGLYNRKNPSKPATRQFRDLDLARAWNYVTGQGVKICIIDAGFDVEDKDIQGNIYKVHDFSTGKDEIRPISNVYHGLECAGVAAAVRNNNYGISGVAPDARLMLAQVINDVVVVDSTTYTHEDQIIKALQWAVANGADIISCSFNCDVDDDLTEAIITASLFGRQGKGCVFIKSAGNNGNEVITYPGTVPGAMAIGAVDSNGDVASFSSYGESLFAVAPGSQIYTLTGNSSAGYESGTSYAAPAVAGVAALILEAYPAATSETVREILAKTATLPVLMKESEKENRAYGKWNKKYGYGLINAYEAVKMAYKLSDSNLEFYELPYPLF